MPDRRREATGPSGRMIGVGLKQDDDQIYKAKQAYQAGGYEGGKEAAAAQKGAKLEEVSKGNYRMRLQD